MTYLRYFLRHLWKLLTPIQLLVIGYALVVLFFAALLSLPIASAKGTSQPFLDALFVATSGISTTGLTVVDIGTYYSLFGQIVLMLDFQIGGLGYMTFFVFVVHALHGRLTLSAHDLATESLAGSQTTTLYAFFRRVVGFTLLWELGGAAVLALYWMREFPFHRAVYLGVFHSVSAFCTAGFGLFPNSLMSYEKSLIVNAVVIVVSLAGGIGFFALHDMGVFLRKRISRESPRRLSVHTKLALAVTAAVVLFGAAVILVSERWPSSHTTGERILGSMFQSISASTTDGFNTVDIAAMSSTSLVMIMLLMFIGASPGGTGGGIKTTTAGILLASTWAVIRGSGDVNLFGRRVPRQVVNKAIAISSLFGLWLLVNILVLASTEKGSFIQIVFEIVSALGNTGLSTGITPALTTVGKVMLSITMFVGRVGPLTLAFCIAERARRIGFRYPEEELLVG